MNDIGKYNAWFDILDGRYIQNITKHFPGATSLQITKLNNLNKLRLVSYASNGQYLNTTFWLSNPFKPFIGDTYTPSYVVYIDSEF